MSEIAIKIENLSKQYRLGVIGTGTLSHDLNRWWRMNILGKEDPFLKIGETNQRDTKGTSDYVWALRDINLEVKKGEVLGIIGKNGAGKSTLLKILSRVTKPTTGKITYKGRIASLLEVGTGFHPEMTGRENIYMNGTIMGMTRGEISRKLDEIVDFAGIERYIDTPVKRYSSGMTVRLGFAIAAHLEPEILVVDEVLAVGDAEFQKKAIGKMQDVSKGEGRTVLFVSHNMGAIKNLCGKGLLLSNGNLMEYGEISKVIEKYFSNIQIHDNGSRISLPNNQKGCFTSWKVSNKDTDDFAVYSDEEFEIEFTFNAIETLNNAELGLVFRNSEGQLIFGCNSRDFGGNYLLLQKGIHTFFFTFNLPIIHGDYEVDIALVRENEIIDQWISTTMLTVKNKFESVLNEKWRGVLNLKTTFHHAMD